MDRRISELGKVGVRGPLAEFAPLVAAQAAYAAEVSRRGQKDKS